VTTEEGKALSIRVDRFIILRSKRKLRDSGCDKVALVSQKKLICLLLSFVLVVLYSYLFRWSRELFPSCKSVEHIAGMI